MSWSSASSCCKAQPARSSGMRASRPAISASSTRATADRRHGGGQRASLDIASSLKPVSSRLLQDVGIDRHPAQALSGCGKDRVGDGGHDAGGPGLAHAAGRLGALDDVNLDRRRLVHADHLVGVEIGLLDTAVLQRDLAIERSGGTKGYPAHELGLDRVGVDDGPAIHRADHAADADIAVLRYLDLGDLREIAAEHELQRDAAADALGQILAPASLFL